MCPQTTPKRKTLIVSHNAGGAAVLAAWVKHQLDPVACDFALCGPALGIFMREFPALNLVGLDVNLNSYQQVIAATSAQDTRWETLFISKARAAGIFCVSLLDHWTNYQTRFLLDGKTVYPDEIWVQDDFAYALTTKIAGYPPVEQIEDYYLCDQAAAIGQFAAQRDKRDELHVLVVTEPSTNPLYSEYTVLHDVLCYLDAHTQQRCHVRLRLHPREEHNKYDAVIENWRQTLSAEAQNRLQIHLSQDSLIEDCAWSDWVVGCQTMAMVVALSAGLKVFSCLPASVSQCALPHTQIERWFLPVGASVE